MAVDYHDEGLTASSLRRGGDVVFDLRRNLQSFLRSTNPVRALPWWGMIAFWGWVGYLVF